MVCAVPMTLWFPKVRKSPLLLFLVSLNIVIGMWIERVMIVIITLTSTHLPSSFGIYIPTRWDWAVLLGPMGILSCLFPALRPPCADDSNLEMRKLAHEIEAPEKSREMTVAEKSR